MPVVPLAPMQEVTLDPAVVAARDALVQKSEAIRNTLQSRVGTALQTGSKLKTLDGVADSTGANPTVLPPKIPDPCQVDKNLPQCKPAKTPAEICYDLGGTWTGSKCDFGTGGGGGGAIISSWWGTTFGDYRYVMAGQVNYLTGESTSYQTTPCPWGGTMIIEQSQWYDDSNGDNSPGAYHYEESGKCLQ
jgi:hypothetical protein